MKMINSPFRFAARVAWLARISAAAFATLWVGHAQAQQPVITAIKPTLVATNPGATVKFTLTANPGTPVASNFWFSIIGGVTNSLSDGTTGSGSVISGSSTTNLTISHVAIADSGGYFAILTNSSGSATSSVATLAVSNFPPIIAGIGPASITGNCGQTASFTVTNSGTTPFHYFWYQETATATNLFSITTNATLSIPGITALDTASYQVVVSNISTINATSAVVSLVVTNDPNIEAQPSSAHGLLDGTAQFSVIAAGTGLSYQWYFADANSNMVAAIANGTQLTGSSISGVNGSLLTIANLQPSDPTNVFVIVTGTFGSAISTVVSLLDVTNQAPLAFWDFNGPEFTNTLVNPNCINNPTPFLGVGAASAVGAPNFPPTSPFSGSVDPNDGLGFTHHLPPFSWGTSHYPTNAGNKLNGVQFNVSTVGARNIQVSYQSRVSATASDYERLQYTTNGTDWTDYPASSTFGSVATTYLPYSYDLSGFPGVANNPNFGFRVVIEYQSTALYGLGATNTYVGTGNSFTSGQSGGFGAGTVTYDLVTVTGEAITNDNIPPIISGGIMDTNVGDFTNLTIDFTVTAGTTPADDLNYSAVSLNPNTVNPTFTFGGSGADRTLKIVPNDPIPDAIDAAPILITATDANGDVAAAWFLLTVTSINLPPTNSLTQAPLETNTLANTTLGIPFLVGDDRTPVSGLTFGGASDNNTLVPSANIIFTNQGTTNPVAVITPAPNQLGVGLLTLTVFDNDPQEPRGTPAKLAFMVRPNTNVIAIDYFNYDNAGSIDQIAADFWTHLSGNFGQMQVGNGVVTVDTLDNTENLQTTLIGAPYETNLPPVTPTTLFASYIANMDPTRVPFNNGSYFTMFNDGSGNTADVEGCVVAATNGAAPGFYRLGIANIVGATALTAQMFPMDLTPGSNYIVIEELNVTNGWSTLWVAPTSSNSPSVTDTQHTALFNISQFELRESGSVAGSIRISKLKVGTTFDSVFPSLSIESAGANAIVNWSDPTLLIQGTTNLLEPFADLPGATPPFTNGTTATNQMFFRFKP